MNPELWERSMHIFELDTPALLIDLDIMERNLRHVAAYTAAHGLRLRPHTKTHKVPDIGKLQLASGAVGLTVAKVSEAEVMLAANPPDLLIAYPVVGRQKVERLVRIARKVNVTVSLDSLVAARQLAEAAQQTKVTIGVLAEVDVGLGRVGVAPGEELVRLAQELVRLPALTFEGIAFFPGHIRTVDKKGREALRQLGVSIQSILQDFRHAGIEVRIVSGGSTPTLFHSHELPGLNEIRPGTYVYNDMNTVRGGACAVEECAASILVTVVSTARPGQIIVDGGSKTFSSDPAINAVERTFGRVLEAPACVFHTMNEEHGFVDIRDAGRAFAVGDHVRIIPNHICPAVNLHERVYGARGETVEQIWQVEGRGKLQ
jgi:D-serine deaminase-like pyridoxal phosphate-dependent protein